VAKAIWQRLHQIPLLSLWSIRIQDPHLRHYSPSLTSPYSKQNLHPFSHVCKAAWIRMTDGLTDARITDRNSPHSQTKRYKIRLGSSRCCLLVLLELGPSQGTERRSKQVVDGRHWETSLYVVAAALSAGMFDVHLSAAVQTHLWYCTAIHNKHLQQIHTHMITWTWVLPATRTSILSGVFRQMSSYVASIGLKSLQLVTSGVFYVLHMTKPM